jgi:hypothetical protein
MSGVDEMMVANFQAMTDCSDRLTAIRMLEQSENDLERAVNMYFVNSAMDVDDPMPPPVQPVDPEPPQARVPEPVPP